MVLDTPQIGYDRRISVTEALSLVDPRYLDREKILRLIGPEIRMLADTIGPRTINGSVRELHAEPHADEPSITLISRGDATPGVIKTLRITDVALAPKYIEFLKEQEGSSRAEIYSFYIEAGKCIYAIGEWNKKEGGQIGKPKKIAITQEIMEEIGEFLKQANILVQSRVDDSHVVVDVVAENMKAIMSQ